MASFTLLLIIFIDGLGTALLLPLLPSLLDPTNPAGVLFGTAPTTAAVMWLNGVLLAGYALAMMVGPFSLCFGCRLVGTCFTNTSRGCLQGTARE